MRRRAALEEIYPNAPLTEVACEVRFPGNVAVECNRHLFWERICEEYPNVLVPHAKPDIAPAMQHYRFGNAEGTRSVAVAINSLAFSEQNYTTHKPFIVEFDRLHRLFGSSYPKLKQVTRVGWRYVNAIPFVRERGIAPISQFLKVNVQLASALPPAYRGLNATVEVATREGVAIVKIATARDHQDGTKEAILLDLDYAFEGTFPFKDVPKLLRKAHTLNRQVFEEMITDQYRAYLRGDSI